jgi:hypothetical protein
LAAIYLAETSISFGFAENFFPEYKHSYLVFDQDGNPETINDQSVIRGGAEFGIDFLATASFVHLGDMTIEVGVPLSRSADSLTEVKQSRSETTERSMLGDTALISFGERCRLLHNTISEMGMITI